MELSLFLERLLILLSAFESKTVNVAVTKLAIRTVAVCFLTRAVAYILFAIKSCPQICKYNYKSWLRAAVSACQGLEITILHVKIQSASRRVTKVSQVGMAEVGWAGKEEPSSPDFAELGRAKVCNAITIGGCLLQPL